MLERDEFVENIAHALITDLNDQGGRRIGRRSTGTVVGITGDWGSGKSSVLNMLAERLKSTKDVVTVLFNPWLFANRDDLIDGFFAELKVALGKSHSEVLRDLRDQVDRYWDVVRLGTKLASLIAKAQGPSLDVGVADEIVENFRPGQSPLRSAYEERVSLEKKLASANVAVVFLIDELDRVEDAEVRAVAQLIKAIGEIRGISYVVAYEPTRVAEALGNGEGEARLQSGERYLEKIVQHPIPLRPLFTEDVEKLLQHMTQPRDPGRSFGESVRLSFCC